ncbi:20254_t:CDS:2 [Entrophospora sp. SA101]|nr:20254_t:CDS:2 [Entrophospora sp. SA101]
MNKRKSNIKKISFFLLHSSDSIVEISITIALDYTIVAFYSFIALIPLSVLVAKKDDFTNSCELKPDYDVDSLFCSGS